MRGYDAKPAPTAEQQQIITAALTGKSGVVEAGAGTGKTSTLVLIAESLAPKRGLYLAYNKAIQVEATTKFPDNVECRTAHSLAYREFGAPRRARLNGRRLSMKQYAAALSIRPFSYTISNEPAVVAPSQIAVVVKESIGRFCNSASTTPSRYHIPKQDGMSDTDRDRFVAHVLPYVTAAWDDITDKNGQLTFTHDCYLKMWSLSAPKLSYDFILFDEAQDANPCIATVVEAQDAQTIMVGDSAQAIYGWRGAVDAMKSFRCEWRERLTQSFRFGNAIAEQANRILAFTGTTLRLSGYHMIESVVDITNKPDAILCRTNAGTIESAMQYQAKGHKVAIVGGTAQIESFVRAANDLMQGVSVNHPDLAIYRNWNDVQVAVQNGEATDLGMLVRLVDNYGVSTILAVCHQSTRPEDADMIVSTAHKAKGLEWDAVQIHTDFKAPKEGGSLSVSEAMLIYVAVTRAKQHLDHEALSWLTRVERDLNEALDTDTEEN